MHYVSVVVPPAPFIDLARAKRHLRVEHNEHDADIEAMVAAATAWLDGPLGWLGRALGPQTLELRTRAWCDVAALPYPPVIEVLSVQHVPSDGAAVTTDANVYDVTLQGLALTPGQAWPALREGPESVIIRYRAGYLDTGSPARPNVPLPIVQAVLVATKTLYEGGALSAEPEGTVRSLLSPFRIYSV